MIYFVLSCIVLGACRPGKPPKIVKTTFPKVASTQKNPYLVNADEFETVFKEKMNRWDIADDVLTKVVERRKIRRHEYRVKAWHEFPKLQIVCKNITMGETARFNKPVPVYKTIQNSSEVNTIQTEDSTYLRYFYDESSIRFFLDTNLFKNEINNEFVFNKKTNLPLFIKTSNRSGVKSIYGIIWPSDLFCESNEKLALEYNEQQALLNRALIKSYEAEHIKELSAEFQIREDRMKYIYDNAQQYLILQDTKPKSSENANQLARMVFAMSHDYYISEYKTNAIIKRLGDRWCLFHVPAEKNILDGSVQVVIEKGQVVSVDYEIHPTSDPCHDTKGEWNEHGEILLPVNNREDK